MESPIELSLENKGASLDSAKYNRSSIKFKKETIIINSDGL
jgi:hypothetical protein